MARFVSELILRLIDAASGPARQVATSIGGITKAIRENNVESLRASSRALGRQMAALKVDLLGAASGMAVYVAALARPVASSREFESTLTDIGQKAEMSRGKVKALGRDLIGVGRDVNQTAQDLAGGVDTLAGLGLDPKILNNTKELVKQMIGPIGRAATAYKAQITDLSNASYAAVSNLKVPVEQTAKVLDVMAFAGKKGAFELKDMAQYMPTLAAAAEGLGQTGVPAVADLAAALQIARRGAGDSAEAATNVGNLLQKIAAPGTVKAFQKMGVDLVGSLKMLEKEGRTPIEAIAELTNKTLGGDMSRLGYLFEDAQVQKALRPLIRDLKDYKRIRAESLGAEGTVQADFAERMKDGAEQARLFKVQTSALALSIGSALLPPINALLGLITPWVAGVTDLAAAHPKLTSTILLAVGGLLAFKTASIAVRLANVASKKGLVDFSLGFVGFANGVRAACVRLILSTVGAGLNIKMFMDRLNPRSVAAFGRALIGLISPMNLVRGGLGLMRIALIGTGIGAVVIGIALAAAFVVRHWRGFVTFFQGVGRGFMAALAPVMPALQPLLGALRNFGAWVAGFFKGNPKEDWSKWGVGVGAALAAPIVGLMNFAKWVGECIDKVKAFFGIKGKPPEVEQEGRRRVGPLNFLGLGRKPEAPAPGEPPAGEEGGRRRLDAGWVGGGKKPPPGRARGGPVLAGHDYMVGEEGPEIVRFPRRGQVYPNGSSPPAAGGGRGALNFSPTLHFHIAGGGDAQAIAHEVMGLLKREFRTVSDASFYDRDLRPA